MEVEANSSRGNIMCCDSEKVYAHRSVMLSPQCLRTLKGDLREAKKRIGVLLVLSLLVSLLISSTW